MAPVLKVSEIFEKEFSKQEEQTLDLKREAREEKKKQQMKKALSKRLELTKACAESCKELVPEGSEEPAGRSMDLWRSRCSSILC